MTRNINRLDLEPDLLGPPTQEVSGLKLKIPAVDNPNIKLPLVQEAQQLNATEAQIASKLQSKFENTAFGKAVGTTTGNIKGVVQSVQNSLQTAQNAVNTAISAVDNTINTATSAVDNTIEGVNSSLGNVVDEIGGAAIGGAVIGAAAGGIVGALAKKSGVSNKIGKAVAIGATVGAGTALAAKAISGVRSRLNPKGSFIDGKNKQWAPDKVPPESLVGTKIDPITGAVKSVNSTVNSATSLANTATKLGKLGLSVTPIGTEIIAGGIAGGVVGGLVNKSGVGNKVGKVLTGVAVGAGAGAVLNVGLNSLQNRLSSIKNSMPKPKVPIASEPSEQRVKTVEIKNTLDDVYKPWTNTGSLQPTPSVNVEDEEAKFLNSDFEGDFVPEGESKSINYEVGNKGERVRVTTNTTRIGNSITRVSFREVVDEQGRFVRNYSTQ